jgi:hypothetical protein
VAIEVSRRAVRGFARTHEAFHVDAPRIGGRRSSSSLFEVLMSDAPSSTSSSFSLTVR